MGRHIHVHLHHLHKGRPVAGKVQDCGCGGTMARDESRREKLMRQADEQIRLAQYWDTEAAKATSADNRALYRKFAAQCRKDSAALTEQALWAKDG